MKILFALIITVLVFIDKTYAMDASPSSVKIEMATDSITCPSQDFSKFIKAFFESEAIQREFTKFPLTKQVLEWGSEPEMKPVIKILNKSQVIFPVIPLQEERSLNDLTFRTDKLSLKHAKVTLFKDGTDYQLFYFFTFDKNSCWILERIEDWSL